MLVQIQVLTKRINKVFVALVEFDICCELRAHKDGQQLKRQKGEKKKQHKVDRNNRPDEYWTHTNSEVILCLLDSIL